MMIQITIILVLGISLVIFLIISQESGKAVSPQRIESSFPDPSAILRVEQTANFFGLKSRGGFQIRGNGVLVLSVEELYFSRFVPA